MRNTRAALTLVSTVLLSFVLWSQDRPAPPALTDAEIEKFLQTAKIVKTRGARKGITGTIQATLSDGTLTHDASIQTINEEKQRFESPSGTELNFRDSYKFNVAAYKLDRMLGLNMTPVSVERKYQGKSGAFTWWVDDIEMDEATRIKKKIDAPDPEAWNCQMYVVRVFDQLIHNMDRNLTNLLISRDWKIWMIDHSRAFRMSLDLREKKNLTRCDRRLFAKLKELNEENLKREIGAYVRPAEIRGLLSRRDKIVEFFDAAGPSALYDLPRPE